MRCVLLLEYSRSGPLLSLPTLLEYIGGGFGLTVASEDVLLVAVDAHDTFTGLEVAEVPYLLAHHCLEHVEHFVLHGEVLALVLFTPLHARQLVHTGIGVRTVFGEQKRLVGFGVHPLVHLVDEGLLGSDELIPILHIPAVIPVQADDIRELMALVFASGGHQQIGVGQRAMLRIERARVIEYLLEIRLCYLGTCEHGGAF